MEAYFRGEKVNTRPQRIFPIHTVKVRERNNELPDIKKRVGPIQRYASLCILLTGFLIAFPGGAQANNDETPPRVWKVSFTGNESYNDVVLSEVVANESVSFLRRRQFWRRSGEIYSETEVRRDVIRLERFFQRRGFPDVQVTYTVDEGRKSWRRHIDFRINEGRPIRVSSFSYSFAENTQNEQDIRDSREFTRLMERNPFNEGRRYRIIRETDLEGDIVRMLKNKGYAFANASVTARIDSLRYEAHVELSIDPGRITYFGELTIQGQTTVRDDLIRKESGISSGDRFSQRSLGRAQQEIFSHHLFRFVTISIPDQPRDSLVDLNIRVREYPLRTLQVRGGLVTEEYVRAAVSWQHRNPFGNGHGFTATARGSFIEQRLSMDYLVPYVFNTFSGFIISPFAQRINESSYLLYSIGATNSFIYQYSQELAGTISYEFTFNEELQRDITFTSRDSSQFFNQSVLRFSGFYNESSIERGEGWAVRPFFEISGFLNTGTYQYNRTSLDVRRFLDVTGTTQLGLRTNGGILFTDSLDEIPSSIQYYLGGNSTVRGWSRNDLGPKRASFDSEGDFRGYLPIGGRVSLLFNSEIRQRVPFIHRNFGVTLFMDAGQVWRTRDDVDLADIQFGTGAGIWYQSPIGPVRFDVGYKVNPTDEDLNRYNGVDYGRPLDRWGFHFSIGQSF
ncbi:MAG: BamA/TamA family outer membrane protein [Bacteroidetes bacterium]|nr:BamA/TamA family outer membrane protein [Bacteroidota bacterium]MCH8524051.1 BamA/TamA family outer membrane protein [Balneolales bacterium]